MMKFVLILVYSLIAFSSSGFSIENPHSILLCDEKDKSLILRMEDQISNLKAHQSFAFVDLDLSIEEIHLLNELRVIDGLTYNRYGNLELLLDEIPFFLRSLGNEEERLIKKVTEIICKTTFCVLQAAEKETAWISIRASKPHPLFDIPRWHCDGSFFGPNSGFTFKFAATLKGNQTLFYNLPPEMREEFNLHMNDREYLSHILDINQSISSKQGFGVFFIVGDAENGAVHSEPPIKEDRLFFSIVMGDKEQVYELQLSHEATGSPSTTLK